MSTRRQRLTRITVAATAALAFAGCGDATTGGSTASGDKGGGKTFVIGVANGQTGYLAPFDGPILAGVKQRVSELNAAGGIAGKHPVEVRVADMRSDIGQQATKAQEFVTAGVSALVLACDSDPAIAGGQVAQRASRPAFGCPSNPAKVGNQLFQMFAPERAHPAAAATYALKRGWKTAFLLGSPDTGYTQNGVEYFKAAYEKQGGKAIAKGSFSLDQQDYATLVQQIKRSGASVVYTTMYEPAIANFLKQLRGAGVDTPVFGDSIESPAVQNLSAAVRKDVYFTSIADTNATAPAGKFIATIRKQYGSDAASVYAILGSDIVSVLDAAVRKAGNDPAKLADTIAELSDVQGVTGKISYDWPGSGNTQLRPVLIKSPLGGSRTKVWQEATPDPSTYPAVIG